MPGAIFQTWTAQQIADHCQGSVHGRPDCRATGISNDGRKIQPSNLFVALRGQRDGHDFIDQARDRGASMFLVEQGREPQVPPDQAVISVEDTYAALVRLGTALWREHGRLVPDRTTIALTGSNGKTTTKNLIDQMLRAAHGEVVLATRGNLNNHIGVPLMLAEIAPHHRYIVLEMGASRPGDIDLLTAIAPTGRALVTSIAPAHLEGFKDLARVAWEKGRIFCGSPAPGVAALPQEWHDRQLLPTHFAGDVRTFGSQATAAVRLLHYKEGSPSQVEYAIRFGPVQEHTELSVPLRLPGEHNALNLAAALAVMWDLLPSTGRPGLVREVAANMEAAAGRLNWLRGACGCWVLDDSYNANPSSTRAALEVHRHRPGRHWAILGDMLELGEQAPEEHREIGRYAGQAGCRRVWAVGALAREVLAGAQAESVEEVAAFDDAAQCARAVGEAASARDVILVKGSRGVRLEQVVQALLATREGETSLDEAVGFKGLQGRY